MREQNTALILLIILCIATSTLPLVRASLEMWSQTYGEEYDDTAYGLVEASDGGYALAGYTDSFGSGGYDFWLIKTDVNGNIMRNQTYGGEYADFAYSLVETSDGGYAMSGKTKVAYGEYTDFWLVRTDERGIPEFPSWTILPIVLAITLFSVIVKRKLFSPMPNSR